MWFCLACYLMYRLGAFNQQHPEEWRRYAKLAWRWLTNWLAAEKGI